MARDASISRNVLGDRIRDRLLEAILAGRYPPGSRIVETRAAREFGTSQAPVREALRELEALGVIEISPFRGARVRRPTTAELLEAYPIRAELEALAVRLAIPRLTPAVLDDLERTLEDLLRAAGEGNADEEAAADDAFHLRLVSSARNATLERVWRLLEPFSRTYLLIALPPADRAGIAELHVPVVEAMRARDAKGAAAAIQRLFAEARSVLGRQRAEPALDEPVRPTIRPARRSARGTPAASPPRRRPTTEPKPSVRTT